MNSKDLKSEFEKHGHWITKYKINGQDYGGNYNAYDDIRLTWFFEHFPDVETILELGSFEGGHTLRLADHSGVRKVLGLEGRQANISRANFVHGLLNVRTTQFVRADLESVDLSQYGAFDAILCMGVLYHLPEPWKLLKQMAKTAPKAYIWTQIASPERATEKFQGYRGRWHAEHGLEDRLSGLSARSFWMMKDDLVEMVKSNGFPQVRIIERENYPPGYPVPKEAFIDLVCQR